MLLGRSENYQPCKTAKQGERGEGKADACEEVKVSGISTSSLSSCSNQR